MMATHEERCWTILTQLFEREESVKTEEGQDYTNYFLEKKNGTPRNQEMVDYLLSKRGNFRINSIFDDQEVNHQRVLDYVVAGKMLLAKSAPCAVQFWNGIDDFVKDSGFFALVQENQDRHLVLFSNSGPTLSHKLTSKSWVYQSDSKVVLNLGQPPLLFIQFQSDEEASFFKDCLLKLNYGPNEVTEVYGPQPVEQLMRRRLYAVGDDSWSKVQSEVLSKIQENQLTVPIIPNEVDLPSPKNPLFACALELKDNWIDAMNVILEDMVLQGVAFYPPENLPEQLNELEKDALTMNIFLPFCTCNQVIHEPVETLSQKIREIRVGIAGVRVLYTLSGFFKSYKEKLTKLTQEMEKKTNLVEMNGQMLGKPEDLKFRGVFSKLKKLKKNVMKQHSGLGRSAVLNHFYKSSSNPSESSFATFSNTTTTDSNDNFTPRVFNSGIYRDFTKLEFTKMRSLSNGGYGAVSVATHNQLQRVVVKMFHENISIQEVEYELEMIKSLQKNKHIVRLYGFFFDTKEEFGMTPYGYVMEYMPLTLHDVIHSHGDSRSDAPTGQFLFSYHLLQCLCKIRGMASAFGAIHALNMTHTDIKPQNVLVDLYMNIKVCDFGTCGTLDKTQTHEKGTNRYMSPEMLSYDENVRIRYTTKTDVYSLAITIWEIFHRKEPFFDIPSDYARCDAIKKGKRPQITSAAWIDPVDELVQKCWAQNQDDRPTMAEIEKFSSDLIDEVEKDKTVAFTKITVE